MLNNLVKKKIFQWYCVAFFCNTAVLFFFDSFLKNITARISTLFVTL